MTLTLEQRQDVTEDNVIKRMSNDLRLSVKHAMDFLLLTTLVIFLLQQI